METAETATTRILDASLQRFLRDGCMHVSVEEIALELGMSKKTFYKHFPSKEDLIRQIVERMLKELHVKVRAIIESDKSFLERLDELVAFLGRQVGWLALPMMRDVQRHMPEIWKAVEQFRRERIATDFKRLLRLGIEEGHIRSDINIEMFLLAFTGAVEAVINPAYLSAQAYSVDQGVRSIMSLFFRGILSEEARDSFAALQNKRTNQFIP